MTTATNTPKFTRKKNLTISFFSAKEEGQSIFVKVAGEMQKSGYVPDGQKEDMIVCPAINLETGEEVNLIVSTVLNNIFTEMPDYVGKSFEIQNQGKGGRGATKYQKFGVWEIEA